MSKAKNIVKECGSKEEAGFILGQEETNDCVVRSVQFAFGVSYVDAHHFCETKLKRKFRQGAFTSTYLPKVKQAFGKKIKPMGKKLPYGSYYKLTRKQKSKRIKWSNEKGKHITIRENIDVRYKVKGFLKEFNEGNYIVTVRQHAFAVINGKIIGNWDDGNRLNREVVNAYRIK
jgi:hypothetical protein